MFDKILIANRGEIACRIARSARSMGVRTVAVYSDADRDALHIRACDEAVYIGKSEAAESYLRGEKIIAAALKKGAQAIHPGFGFLSENAAFAESCANSDLVFIGPRPQAIRDMGSKSAARQIMQDAGVPVLPGYDGEEQDEDFLLEEARKVGFPLLIKAVLGGGGKGLRAVEDEADFLSALQSVKRESMAAFADDTVLLERYLPTARHIEIQIFADSHGNVVHLFERDCSLQRRHQKVIEEAPAPGLNDILRADIARAAIKCAKATHYLGAGTVEFLLAPDKTFYFMEMNTRLQVEHPVTEMITQQDLVAWQLKVAAGEALPADQRSLAIRGHAIEARIYAENPEQNFLPSTGTLELVKTPETSTHVRIDTGIEQGNEISPYYDPMIAKLICHGSNRTQAMARLKLALDDYNLIGTRNNIRFLSTLCSHRKVAKGGADTRFIDTHLDELIKSDVSLDENALVSAATYHLQRQLQGIKTEQSNTDDPWSAWADASNWRVAHDRPQHLSLKYRDRIIDLSIHSRDGGWTVVTLEKFFRVEQLPGSETELNLLIIDSLTRSIVVHKRSEIILMIGNRDYTFHLLEAGYAADNAEQHKDSVLSPMPGKIIACQASPGKEVHRGDTLMVIEAMKMEHSIQAPHDGEIEEVYFMVGDQVEDGDRLLSFKDQESESEDPDDSPS
mgnify:CR=1 FL=1